MKGPQKFTEANAAHFVIPTSWRGPLTTGRAYPLGAEDLSRAFDGLPQLPLLTCSFVSSRGLSPRRRAKIKPQHQGTPIEPPIYHVLQIKYQQRERSIHAGTYDEERGAFEPAWTVTVTAVPSDLRHAIKTKLLAEALPSAVRPWLLARADVTGALGSCEMDLRYDAEAERLFSVATDNLQPRPA